jgi:hypothetical protein
MRRDLVLKKRGEHVEKSFHVCGKIVEKMLH